MLEDLLNGASDTAPTAISTHVKRILVGAAPLSRRLAAACRSAFPMAAIVSAYGMTEACSSICFSRELPGSLEVEDMAGSPESSADDSGQCVGCPPPGIEVAADMMTGTPSANIEFISPGVRHSEVTRPADEICVRGPNILLRYCGTDWQPEAGGWFRTGDLGWHRMSCVSMRDPAIKIDEVQPLYHLCLGLDWVCQAKWTVMVIYGCSGG